MTERDGEHGPRRAPDLVASLVCHVATRTRALPLGVVIEPIAGAPAFVRGESVPVVDAAS